MTVRQVKYNMADIKDRVNAAELLQQAGMPDDAKKVLEDLARDILSDDSG